MATACEHAFEMRGTPNLNGRRNFETRENLISGWRLSSADGTSVPTPNCP
jgi:hypothetical protein